MVMMVLMVWMVMGVMFEDGGLGLWVMEMWFMAVSKRKVTSS